VNIAWYRFRRALRRRLPGYVGVVVLLAVLGGVALAAVAGARRTASGFDRFLAASNPSDLAVDSGAYDPEATAALRRLPQVTGVRTYVAFLAARLDADGAPILDEVTEQGEWVGSLDGLYFDQDRVAITRGRMARPSRVDEVVVSESMADLAGFEVGQELSIGVFDEAEVQAAEAAPPTAKDVVEVTIVGVGLFTDEVVQDEVDRVPRILSTPAFTARERRWATYAWTGLQLARGAADVPAVKAGYADLLEPGAPTFFRDTAVTEAQAQRAIRPQAVALGVFGLIALLAALVLAGQAVARQLAVDGDDLAPLRALGADTRTLSVQGLIGAVLVSVVGVALAVVVAMALSPLAPIGSLRQVEVDPGFSVDWTVLGGGALVMLALLLLIAAGLARRQVAQRTVGRSSDRSERRSRVVGAASAAGMSVAAVAGMRRALRGGTGRSAVAARSVIAGATIAIAAMVASLTFGASLDALISEPRLFGWDWDEMLVSSSGYGNLPDTATDEVLSRDPAVDTWSGVYFGEATLDGVNVAALGGEAGASVHPPILSGHPLQSSREVVLGEATLRQLHKHTGDQVTLTGGTEPVRLKIVGTATFPTLGVGHGSHTSMGSGALLPAEHLVGVDRNDSLTTDPGPNAVLIRFRPGVDRAQARRRLAAAAPTLAVEGNSVDLTGVRRPAEIVNYEDMGSAPALLAGGLLAAALLSLILALFASVRRQRRELAFLKALGLTRRQVVATITWEAVVTVGLGSIVGVPLGVVAGRGLWTMFARQLHAVVRPEVPLAPIAVVGVGAIVVAVLVAAVPGRSAARIPTSALLRAE
jgi:hypothetical protein